jgi:hypothetical protein
MDMTRSKPKIRNISGPNSGRVLDLKSMVQKVMTD